MNGSKTGRLRGARGTLSARPYSGAHFVLDLVECCCDVLRLEASLSWHEAMPIALHIGKTIASHWGRNKLHFPKAMPSTGTVSWFRLDERNASIAEEYHGANMATICERYGLRHSAVHAIVANARRARRLDSVAGRRADVPATQPRPDIERGPELLHELRAHIESILSKRAGPVGRLSAELATRIAEHMGHRHGGQRLWLPNPRPGGTGLSWFTISARDRDVMAALLREEPPESIASRFQLRPSLLPVIRARFELEERARRLTEPPSTLPATEPQCATPSM